MFFDEGQGREGAAMPSDIFELEHDTSFEEKVEKNRVVTSEDIDQYVDQLIEKLKATTSKEEQIHLIEEAYSDIDGDLHIFKLKIQPKQPKKVVLGDLSENKVLSPSWSMEVEDKEQKKKIKFDENDREIQLIALKRIRQAVIERLKDRLTKEKELEDINYSDINVITSHVNAHLGEKYIKEHVSYATDLNAKEKIVRNDRTEWAAHTDHDKKIHRKAIQKLLQLPAHEHLLNYSQYDLEKKKAIVEKLKLHTLLEVLSIDQPFLEEVLEILRDGMKGGVFLQNHGLVAQDISLDNIGIVVNKNGERKGVLFDLEGMYLANEKRIYRMAKSNIDEKGKILPFPNYYPPETRNVDPTPVTPLEMVYQFGMCLKEIKDNHSDFKEGRVDTELVQEFDTLIKDMSKFNAQSKNPIGQRISLEEALRRVELLIGKLKVAAVNA